MANELNLPQTQWGWSDMEELMQCPVCMELPVGSVPLCEQGHHICMKCRVRLRECPLCKSPFLENGRYWLVEQLLANITQIKTCMTLSNILSPKPAEAPTQVVSPPRLEVPPVQSRGVFPCSLCPLSQPVCRMHVHFAAAHSKFYKEIEGIVTPNQVNCTFNVELRVSAGSSAQAFKIKRLGLVFFNLVVANNKFHFFLRMVATQEGAKNVSYYLKIPNICNNYVSKMYSCRQSTRSIIVKNRCLTVEQNAIKSSVQIKRTGVIPLTVTVTKNLEVVEPVNDVVNELENLEFLVL